MQVTNNQTDANKMKDNAILTKTLKIGRNRGKSRLWIEGSALLSMGWTKGRQFFPVWITDSNGTGTLEFRGEDTSPGRKGRSRNVAGTDVRPIIDTNTDRLTARLYFLPLLPSFSFSR